MSWLRNIIGPPMKEVWQEVANDLEATFVQGGLFSKHKVQYTHKGNLITMDTYKTGGKNRKTYTRIRANFISLDEFNFRIYEANVLSSLSKAIGLQDIAIGIPKFDNKYMIKGSNEEKVKQLFASEIIRETILSIPEYNTRIQASSRLAEHYVPGQHHFEIYYDEYGRLKDKKKITQLFTLNCLLIDQLGKIDSAGKVAPKVS